MPAYDYRCVSCETTFEITRPFGASGEIVCPACGGSTKRVFTPVGVHFKGSGFHNTDYKSAKRHEPPAGATKGSCDASGSSAACADCPAAD